MASENDRKAIFIVINQHWNLYIYIYVYIYMYIYIYIYMYIYMLWVKRGKTIVHHPHIYIYISEIISVKLRLIKLGEKHVKTIKSNMEELVGLCGTDATAHQYRDGFKAMHFFIYIYIIYIYIYVCKL